MSPPPCSVRAMVQAHWPGGGRWETFFTLVFLGPSASCEGLPPHPRPALAFPLQPQPHKWPLADSVQVTGSRLS